MSQRWRSIALVTGLLLIGLSGLAGPITHADAPRPVDESGFGLAFINSVEMPRSAARVQRGLDAGAQMDRFPLYWNNIEGQPGRFEWAQVDQVVRTNEAAGLDNLLVLLGTSRHHYPGDQPQPSESALPVGGVPLVEAFDSLADRQVCRDGMRPPNALNEPLFADGTDVPGPGKAINLANPWGRFVASAVARYRPGGAAGTAVRHWEVWNEPDLCQFWSGTARQYARLLKVSYLAIKHSDPAATVVWGGLAHYENPDFLPALVHALRTDPDAAAHNGFFDAAASHHYSDVTKGQRYTQRIRDALAGSGWEQRPIWITESGVPVCGDEIGPPCPDAHRADEAGQAAYIWQSMAYTRLAGGGPIFHFQLHDDCGNEQRSAPPADAFGLATNEGNALCVPHLAQPRLAFSAFRLAAEYFPGTEVLWEDEVDGVRRVAFFHPATGERRLLLWATGTADTRAPLPAIGEQARRIALDGSYVDLSPQEGIYEFDLPGSTNPRLPNSATYIGGAPYLIIERDTRAPSTRMTLEVGADNVFELRWEADDGLGSGVVGDGVEVWIQMNEEPWQPWLAAQPPEGATRVQGIEGEHYRFAALATDRAGNSSGAPGVQAELFLQPAPPPAQLFLPLTHE